MYNWEVKRFSEFSLVEFHDLIALRIDVFIIEQDCPYQELDGKDQLSLHLIASKDGQIVATDCEKLFEVNICEMYFHNSKKHTTPASYYL